MAHFFKKKTFSADYSWGYLTLKTNVKNVINKMLARC